MELGGQNHATGDLPSGKKPGTNFTGDSVGPKAYINGRGEETISRSLPGF